MSLRSPLRAIVVFSVVLASCALHAETQLAYKAGKARISAELKSDRNACATLGGNVREVCFAQAIAKQKVARAELEFGSSGKPADEHRVQEARAEADYSVARQMCDAQAGNARDVCVKEAKAIQTKALVDAKSNQKVVEIELDAQQAKRNADYSVAVEKCDAMAGDTKSSCIAAAKGRFGKT